MEFLDLHTNSFGIFGAACDAKSSFSSGARFENLGRASRSNITIAGSPANSFRMRARENATAVSSGVPTHSNGLTLIRLRSSRYVGRSFASAYRSLPNICTTSVLGKNAANSANTNAHFGHSPHHNFPSGFLLPRYEKLRLQLEKYGKYTRPVSTNRRAISIP